jgi:hypothetical protein
MKIGYESVIEKSVAAWETASASYGVVFHVRVNLRID